MKWHDGEQVPQEVDEDSENVDIVAEDGEENEEEYESDVEYQGMTRLRKRRRKWRTNFVYRQKPKVVEFVCLSWGLGRKGFVCGWRWGSGELGGGEVHLWN